MTPSPQQKRPLYRRVETEPRASTEPPPKTDLDIEHSHLRPRQAPAAAFLQEIEPYCFLSRGPVWMPRRSIKRSRDPSECPSENRIRLALIDWKKPEQACSPGTEHT